MRLTLRTLLAYLDDTLEPAQAKLIGQKVAESEAAQELMERIKQVTRRRRITTPPPTGPGAKIDPNTISGYLENTLTPEQLNEVEQVCLASDAHLAEIAACHQILTLVLGEPALVPPTAKQRMYGLVKGPESIPFRKPPQREYTPEGDLAEEDADETLRLGLPLFRRGTWTNRVLLAGGGVLVGALLVVAILQILGPLGNQPEPRREIAQGEQEKKPEPIKVDPIIKPTPPDPIVDKKAQGKEEKPPKQTEVEPPAPRPPLVEVIFAPPSAKQVVAGQWQQPAASETSVLLQLVPSREEDQKPAWKRFGAKRADVYTARPLVSLPGCQSTVETTRGVLLTLSGSLPELWPVPTIYESLVELHAHDQLDLDLTLRRGRIVLANKQDKPAQVRIRFENPTNPDAREYVDVTLLEKNSRLMVDRWGYYPRQEPFFKDAGDPERRGPVVEMGFLTQDGHVSLRANDLTVSLQAPPGPAVFLWNSRKGPNGPLNMPKLPEWTSPNPPLPQGMDLRVRTKMLAARDNLATSLSDKEVDVALTEAKESPDDNYRRMAVRCYGALDDLASLLDALEEKYSDVRTAAIETLRFWSGSSRDHDARLFQVLKGKYNQPKQRGVPERVMELLHSFSEEQTALPSTYETLIEGLNNPETVIRELSSWHLYQLVPQGRQIPYASVVDEGLRREAQKMWFTLVPPGQLPRQPMATPMPK